MSLVHLYLILSDMKGLDAHPFVWHPDSPEILKGQNGCVANRQAVQVVFF